MNEKYYTNLINIRLSAFPFFRDIGKILPGVKNPQKRGVHRQNLLVGLLWYNSVETPNLKF
jgi:hypothetical protein